MKNFLIFLLLIFVYSSPSNEKLAEIKIKKKSFEQTITDCVNKNLLRNSRLKNLINENENGNLMTILNSNQYKLDKDELEVFKYCRKKYFKIFRKSKKEKKSS